MTGHYRDEAAEIEHLEGHQFPAMSSVGGTTIRERGPLHVWRAGEFGDTCARCHMQRFVTQSRRWGQGFLYQKPNGQTKAGVEPRCVPRGKR